MKIKIEARNCKISDYSFVYNLTKRSVFDFVSRDVIWSKKHFDKDFHSEYKHLRILYLRKRKIGFYMLENKPTHLFVTKLYLTESYRNKGIGSHLMKKFELETKKKRVRLEVWKGNPAKNIYKKLGYKTIGYKNHKYLMERVLKPNL